MLMRLSASERLFPEVDTLTPRLCVANQHKKLVMWTINMEARVLLFYAVVQGGFL
jgi:hypothetical protein